MFGGGKEKMISRVGAREKLKQARAIMGGAPSKSDDKRTPPAVAVLVIFVMSVALAYILSEQYIANGGLRLSTGSADIDRILFKPGQVNFFGSPEIDYVFLILLRGLAIFFAAGIWPFTCLVVQKALDNAQINLYRLFWGTPIGLVLFVLIIKEYFWPALSEIFGMLT